MNMMPERKAELAVDQKSADSRKNHLSGSEVPFHEKFESLRNETIPRVLYIASTNSTFHSLRMIFIMWRYESDKHASTTHKTALMLQSPPVVVISFLS